MTNKLVITANMNSAEPASTSPTAVTYQWHWRRIFMFSGVILVALATVIYSFVGAVSAEQSEQDEPHTELTTAVLQAPDNNLAAEHVNENTEDSAEQPDVNTPDLVPNSVANEPETESLKPKTHVQSLDTVTSQDTQLPAKTTTDSEAKPENNDEQQLALAPNNKVQQFSQSAHVASVAIGAKIDTDKVSRAVLTTDVVDREPVNVLKNDVRLADITHSLSFFSELRNMQGQTVRHQWYYQDEQLASIELAVSSPRYRTYSTKNIMPEQLGEWRVEVVDEQGTLLAQKEFRILAD